ncbi:transposase [Bartonella quintana]|uniref:transposase n=1 Tax=Bartonella quintana TaxID=803 RepID=UPI001374A7BD
MKYRRKIFPKALGEDFRLICKGIFLDFEVEYIEFDGKGDSVQLLINPSPKGALSSPLLTV